MNLATHKKTSNTHYVDKCAAVASSDATVSAKVTSARTGISGAGTTAARTGISGADTSAAQTSVLGQAILQIDVPFCVHPCDFRPNCRVIAGWDSQRMRAYMRAVRLEVQANAADLAGLRVVAVRFGGGIASNAGEDIWETMRCLRSCLDIANDAPVTMRSSVSNISGANMTWFKRAGVSRFDFEIMSLNQMDFFLLNHTDSLTDFTTICDYILRPQQTNLLGLVLVYGHSAKTHRASIQNFRATLFAALRSHAVHLKLLRYDAKSATASAESGIAEEHLASAREILAENGFCEYIPLHFAPAGFEDKYNLLRVSKHDSDNSVAQLGFGLNARTVIDGIVATNTSDLALYLQKSADYQAITASVQTKSAPLAVLSP